MAASDRPLRRKLIRLAFLAGGRSVAHRQDLWPGLAIDRASGVVTWRDRPLLTLQSGVGIVAAADSIAIIGSGPSLKGQHLHALGDRGAILLNGAAQLAGRVRPLAVAVEDERFVFRHHAMLAAVPRDIPLLLSPAAMRAWAERGAEPLRDRAVALIDNLVKPVNARRRSLDDPALARVLARDGRGAISIDPDAGVVICGTVALTAMQFALAARPADILLAGIDLTNDDQPRFYETTDRAPSGLTAGRDRILAGFAIARQVAIRDGIVVKCASPVSALLGLGYARDDRLDPARSP